MEETRTQRGPMFEVVRWQAVATWTWDGGGMSCAICRNNLLDQCIECAAGDGDPEYAHEECHTAWGQCNHVFHRHCINRWLLSRSVCPLDNTAWAWQLPAEPNG